MLSSMGSVSWAIKVCIGYVNSRATQRCGHSMPGCQAPIDLTRRLAHNILQVSVERLCYLDHSLAIDGSSPQTSVRYYGGSPQESRSPGIPSRRFTSTSRAPNVELHPI